ncbi:MAG: hypothetical protein JW798_06080 [Prolixibacteraceae bacterium]|nr:hypothetical protein [Prolixibacteraceae bacterium]
MKKSITILFLLITVFTFSQKNEILMLPGITTNQFWYDQGAVFQFKYEREIVKTINFQVGLRYHNEIRQETLDGLSLWIQSVFNSYKLDASILVIPINKERFKLKTGIGFDIGVSNYYWAARGRTIEDWDVDENDVAYRRDYTFWQYDIDRIADIGAHFILQGNYYFKNNLFITAQVLYNYVFDDEVANPEYSKTLYRNSPICLSAGMGFRF